MSDLPEIRHTIESLFALKVKVLGDMERLTSMDRLIRAELEPVGGCSPYDVRDRELPNGEHRERMYVDRVMWRFVVRQYSLDKYMLCTDWTRMAKEIDDFRTPEFTVGNVEAWTDGLKSLIHDNVRVLVKKVYQEIINGTYYVGTGYNAAKKKRNNSGVDKSFILHTGDHQSMFRYWSDSPSITDDLEKVCYILDGKTLPNATLKARMKSENALEASDDYMSIKVCMNGNTHFKIADSIRERLNRYGPSGAEIGENIKIKVFESRWV